MFTRCVTIYFIYENVMYVHILHFRMGKACIHTNIYVNEHEGKLLHMIKAILALTSNHLMCSYFDPSYKWY